MSIDPSCIPRTHETSGATDLAPSQLRSIRYSALWQLLSVVVLLGSVTVGLVIALYLETSVENASFLTLGVGSLLGSMVLALARKEAAFRESVVAGALVAVLFVFLMVAANSRLFSDSLTTTAAAAKALASIALGVGLGGLMGRRNAHWLGPAHPLNVASLSLFGGAGLLFCWGFVMEVINPDVGIGDSGGLMVLAGVLASLVAGFLTQLVVPYRRVKSSGSGLALFVLFIAFAKLIFDRDADTGRMMIGCLIISVFAWLLGAGGARLGWWIVGRNEVEEPGSSELPAAQMNS